MTEIGDTREPDARLPGFTYTVLDPGDGDVIRGVCLCPTDGAVRSWVRAGLDPVLHAAVSDRLRRSWPFETIDYAPRASTPT